MRVQWATNEKAKLASNKHFNGAFNAKEMTTVAIHSTYIGPHRVYAWHNELIKSLIGEWGSIHTTIAMPIP